MKMKMKIKKKQLAGILITAVLSASVGVQPAQLHAAAKPRLSKKKIAIEQGKNKTLKVLNTKKKAKWKITSGKKYIALKKKTAKSVTIQAKKKGTA